MSSSKHIISICLMTQSPMTQLASIPIFDAETPALWMTRLPLFRDLFQVDDLLGLGRDVILHWESLEYPPGTRKGLHPGSIRS